MLLRLATFGVCVVLLACCAAASADIPIKSPALWAIQKATVYYRGGKYDLVVGVEDTKQGLAWASFNSSVNASGWAVLNLTTNANADPTERWYAAGYLEGALTYDLMWDYYMNLYATDVGIYSNKELEPVINFIEQNDVWVLNQIKADHSSQGRSAVVYWEQVGYIMRQFQGMYDAYQRYAPGSQAMTRLNLLMTNLDGDMFDIIPAFIPSAPTLLTKAPRPGHCTSFVRFTRDELFCAHNTWDSFQMNLRIFKHYNFPAESSEVAATNMLFSSYPGTLSSEDDFYVMNSKLYVTETTNNNYNMTLYRQLTPNTVMSWVRAMVANRLAHTSKQWTEIYALYNSGTYNNQWVIVDHSRFTPGQMNLPFNTVWILEQIPGAVRSADVTPIVNARGYWAGYNVPFFHDIFNAMGYPWAVSQWGQEYTWNNCSRANIFRRDAPKVRSLDDMKYIMQYNDWQNDPFSSGEPCNSIAARCDLDTSDPDTSGAYDAKVTSHKLFMEMQAWGISGPTHQNQPVFVWNTPGVPHGSHLGQPNRYDFTWQHFA